MNSISLLRVKQIALAPSGLLEKSNLLLLAQIDVIRHCDDETCNFDSTIEKIEIGRPVFVVVTRHVCAI